jgi:uncharacterized membrane protein (DUF441 family)
MRRTQWRDPGRLMAERARQLGQSSMEYTVVIFFAVLVLLVPDANGDVPVVQLANAFKRFYTGFAYAVSLSTTIMPM